MAKIVKLKPTPKGEPRWGVRWKENGKERQSSFRSRSEAQLFRSQKEVEQPRKRKVLKRNWQASPLFHEVARAFLKDLAEPEPGVDPRDPRTVRTYKSVLSEHVLPHIGKKAVSNIGADDYRAIHSLCTSEAMSPRTRNEALRLTRAVLTFASVAGYIESVPENPIKNRMTRAERQSEKLKGEKKFYSPDEVYTMLAAADSLADDTNKQTRRTWARYRPLVYFLVYTGARISEARAFPRSDYQPETGWVHITQSAPEGEGSYLAKATDSIRRVPLNPELRAPLEAWMNMHERNLIFGTAQDRPVSLTTLYPRLLEPLKDRADALAESRADARYVKVRRDRTFHAFRHHFASWLVKEGANLKQLQSYMGHAKVTFTLEVYGHLFDDDGTDLAARMSMKNVAE